jgi:AbrB family looped-hinge helix DNA binding protein
VWPPGARGHDWHILVAMTALRAPASKISPEGRIVVPAEIRRLLAVRPGDTLEFEVQDGNVLLVTPRARAAQVWANNHGGDAGDSVRSVRAARSGDQDAVRARWARVDLAVEASRSRDTAALTAELLSAVGFDA